ncbi:MAG: hypothetical protein KDC90_00285 [Ignavibacteriae bacterium]|nr:hypothetical protein [Ignavibacteriota bacterium]
MEKPSQQPLNFFEEFLQSNKISLLKERMINDFIDSGRYMGIESIDRVKGIVRFNDVYYDEQSDGPIEGITILSFENHLSHLLKTEFEIAKKYLDNTIADITKQGSNPSEYIWLQLNLLSKLELKAQTVYEDTPNVKDVITRLSKHIGEKYLYENHNSALKTVNSQTSAEDPDNFSPNSFLWDAIDHDSRIEQLNKLYDLLTANPKVIDCAKEDFINAFSQKKVVDGIYWCIKGKNNMTSKSSLFYFLEQLNQENFIQEVPSYDLNKKVEYVFRDIDGNPLKNIRQSKSNNSTSPTGKEQIDQILQDIFN